MIYYICYDYEYLRVGYSGIHGKGIFTKEVTYPGTYLFTAIHRKKITPTGAMINHCDKPNVVVAEHNDIWKARAKYLIPPNTELFIDYNTAPPELVRRPNPSWTC